MSEIVKKCSFLPLISLCLILPAGILLLGEYPERGLLKNTLSVITLGAFFLMLMQMFLVRNTPLISSKVNLQSLVGLHKKLGYIAFVVLLCHPFFLVFPHFFESGLSPLDAFIQIIGSIETPGIFLGLIAYALMLLIGITSIFRKNLPMRYHTWRRYHGYLSIIFIIAASWHVIELGRHMSPFIDLFICLSAGVGSLLLLKTYWIKAFEEENHG